MSGKNTLQGTVKGGTRKTKKKKKKKKWEDNIDEWTVLEFAKSQKAVENGRKRKKKKKKRKLVVKSSVVPQ